MKDMKQMDDTELTEAYKCDGDELTERRGIRLELWR